VGDEVGAVDEVPTCARARADCSQLSGGSLLEEHRSRQQHSQHPPIPAYTNAPSFLIYFTLTHPCPCAGRGHHLAGCAAGGRRGRAHPSGGGGRRLALHQRLPALATARQQQRQRAVVHPVLSMEVP
jgi:hypothetical protein